ncbi:leucine-rich repeats and immunoglobulin-like domains protein 2 isoform X2 [Hypomesus transpacificus]|uniref:leucine-rich repeats and immunoglobulin-like domains protein 2 isoform X2 n=1 Tax=Hypomesus transpacificus TaxID=137520 RepID=UPI001F086990|nr:leucine-rich repeats and immunoglobulin-like domains protein 2 isoform X2 [Hypomesus transpacificus]
MAEGWTVHQAVLVFSLMSLTALGLESCPPPCSCRLGSDEVHVLDCSRKKLSVPPLDLPDGITHVSLNHNDLIAVPYLGDVTSNITSLSLVHNRISELATLLLQPYVSLETLDLSSNSLSEIKAGAFPSMQLKYLNLSNNKISLLEPGCFDNISSSLLVLRLNRNRIALLPYKVFRLPRLQLLEFKRNKIKMVDSLIFKGMEALKTLKMQRNGITKLMDGAFFGLNNIEELELEHNNLTEVNKGWLYGLRRLRLLRISHNSLTLLRPDSWEFCHNLEELDLSFNHMSRLEGTALAGLAQLQSLNLGDNALTHLGEGAFSSLASLRTLDIRNNEISWAIEDSVGVFVGMKKLTTLILQQNKIKSITKKAFDGLDELEHLDLSKNGIMSIHPEAVAHMHLKEFLLNSSSLLCDCLLQWLSPWLSGQPFQGSVRAVCAYPSPLQGQSLLEVAPGLLLCDDFPKPLITTHPESSTVLRGTNVTLSCLAASSSDSPMAAAWRRDGELLYEPEVQTYARFQDGQLLHSSLLHLLHVNFTDEGRYQCVVSNHFGSNYSNRARLTVNELPSFLKTPMDLTLRTGTMARLECAAEGHPAPQIAWQKDGGTDFPAARERRMHVMPDDDIFFIANVKTEDMGVYSCTAQNTAGSLSANATLTVLETPSLLRPLEDRVVARGETAVLQCIAGGSPAPRINWTKDDGPLVLTERHFFAAANQLLIIVEAGPGDAGRYTCSMSNTLGTERGQVYLGVAPQAGCEAGDADGWATVGIVVMVVVSCVVGTSLVWVIVIYHMRRRGEDYSITNTDELTLPADIPSYLSSQGTLSEPVEGYSNSEAGSHQQLMPPLSNTHTHKGTDGVCYGDTGSEVEAEPSRGSSLFTGSEVEAEPSRGSSLFTGSFYPGETEGLGGGAAGPLVTCSDCYDNGSMYSRPRESCPFLSEEDALEQALPPRPPGGPHHAPRHTPDSSQDPSLCRGAGGAGGHPQHSCSVSSRSFWAEGRDPTLQAPPQPPGPRGAPPPGLASGEGQEEGGGGPQYILQKCLLQD